MVNITPMHTVSTPPGEYKYEVGTKSVVGGQVVFQVTVHNSWNCKTIEYCLCCLPLLCLTV